MYQNGQKKNLQIRNPNSTRPWQHVFDVLIGYAFLAINLKQNKKINGESFNFGPSKSYNFKVIDLIKLIKKHWVDGKILIKKNKSLKEAKLLQLNSKKSNKILKWKPKLNLFDSIYITGIWYKKFYEKKTNMYKFSLYQLESYLDNIKKILKFFIKTIMTNNFYSYDKKKNSNKSFGLIFFFFFNFKFLFLLCKNKFFLYLIPISFIFLILGLLNSSLLSPLKKFG